MGSPGKCRQKAAIDPPEMEALHQFVDGDDIRHAVVTLFGVSVVGVRTANYLGMWRRVGRSVGRRAAYKKAIVKLAPGEQIDVYEGV